MYKYNTMFMQGSEQIIFLFKISDYRIEGGKNNVEYSRTV